MVEQLEKDAVLMAHADAVKGLEAMKLLLGYCAILDIKDKVNTPHILPHSYKLITCMHTISYYSLHCSLEWVKSL